MDRRIFLVALGYGLTGSAFLLCSGGCIAPRVSSKVYDKKVQAWRCSNCGHLTRTGDDLTDERCPRCKRKGFFARITEEKLERYLEESS